MFQRNRGVLAFERMAGLGGCLGARPGVMKMHLLLDAHSLNFLHHFYSESMVSGVRFRVSGKVDATAYPEH